MRRSASEQNSGNSCRYCCNHENEIVSFSGLVTSQNSMKVKVRPGTPADAEICGRICHHAFKTISEAHGFAPDFPAPEVAIHVLTQMLSDPKFYSVVAEVDGRIVG